MSAPTKLFLEFNDIDGRFKVLDKKGFCFGDGQTIEDAIASARIVSDVDIYDGENIISKTPTSELIQDKDELINALAEIGGMKVSTIFDDNYHFKGYKMELVE